MTQVRLETIVVALRRAGLLVAERGALPEFIGAVTDDSQAVRSGALFLAVRGSARDSTI